MASDWISLEMRVFVATMVLGFFLPLAYFSFRNRAWRRKGCRRRLRRDAGWDADSIGEQDGGVGGDGGDGSDGNWTADAWRRAYCRLQIYLIEAMVSGALRDGETEVDDPANWGGTGVVYRCTCGCSSVNVLKLAVTNRVSMAVVEERLESVFKTTDWDQLVAGFLDFLSGMFREYGYVSRAGGIVQSVDISGIDYFKGVVRYDLEWHDSCLLGSDMDGSSSNAYMGSVGEMMAELLQRAGFYRVGGDGTASAQGPLLKFSPSAACEFLREFGFDVRVGTVCNVVANEPFIGIFRGDGVDDELSSWIDDFSDGGGSGSGSGDCGYVTAESGEGIFDDLDVSRVSLDVGDGDDGIGGCEGDDDDESENGESDGSGEVSGSEFSLV